MAGSEIGGGDSDEQEKQAASARAWLALRADFFDARRPVLVARAPGRLDVMGGIADYSGSLVLELPLAVATWVAVQPHDKPTLVIESSDGTGGHVTIPIEDVVPAAPLPYAEAHARLTRDPARAWAAYVAGALVVMHGDHARPLRHGARVLVRSDVPVGKGVSSSAALDVAAFAALAALVGVPLDDRGVALAAQRVENLIAGAPCGVMDQMTAACGRRGHLLELLCQPAEIVGHLALPPTLELFGVDSGIHHAVTGADYGSVRAAAFMGYRIVADAAGLAARVVAPGRVAVDDTRYGGYLANVTQAEWRSTYRDVVPEAITGSDFLARFGGSTDAMTAIDEARRYAVRAAAEHPVLEHERVRQFRALLAGGAASEDDRVRLGELMYEAHASYSACGLGSDGTDRLVALCRAAGPAGGIYGAKITGGGCGGTVAVLAAPASRPAIEAIARQYRQETGRDAAIFAGSSSGASAFGVRTLDPS